MHPWREGWEGSGRKIILFSLYLYPGVLNPSYLPVKSTVEVGHMNHTTTSSASPIPQNPTLELKEFAPLDAYQPHTSYQPHFSFTHHLYVYPSSLKYDSQKTFTKVRSLGRLRCDLTGRMSLVGYGVLLLLLLLLERSTLLLLLLLLWSFKWLRYKLCITLVCASVKYILT